MKTDVNMLLASTHQSTLEVVPWNGAVAVRKTAQQRTPKSEAQWKNEAAAMARVAGQKNLTHYLSSDASDLSIVMRRETGKSLDQCVQLGINTCSIEADDANLLWSQMANALAFLHSKNVIHDDVKPENIVWDADMSHGVLIDFGAAIITENFEDVHFSPSGTPPYAPPEFLQKRKGPEGDMWGLGITMLFAKRFIPLPEGEWILPHVFGDDASALRDMTDWLETIESLREKCQKTDPALAKMLISSPKQRIDSVGLVEELKKGYK